MGSSLRLRFILKELRVARLWGAWTCRSVVRRCKSERTVLGVIECFKQSLLNPKRTLLFTVTAAYKSDNDDDDDSDNREAGPCTNSITDEELQMLVNDFQRVEDLAKKTLFCEDCDKRLDIDKKQPGVVYCPCKQANQPAESLDGWLPYMEADDVVIWRKEYKPGQGLYAYKVYGRYEELRAQDFAAVQVDGGYRRAWDTAVAALFVVERHANGVPDQAVLHWEVLWPRLFANRDYVYIRRHKEFTLKPKCMVHKDGIFAGNGKKYPCQPEIKTEPTKPKESLNKAKEQTPKKDEPPSKKTETMQSTTSDETQKTPETKPKYEEERTNVHSTAKRKALEAEKKELERILEASKNKSKEGCVCIDEEDCKDKERRKEIELKQCNHPNSSSAIKPVDSAKSIVNIANSNKVGDESSDNTVYVIISRSCSHSEVPETSRCVRVTEYWSNMVVQTLYGPDKPGMEFVLTYYDEPAVGGMPSGVTAWATGRAAPAYLNKMRQATTNYKAWRFNKGNEEAPDFTPAPTGPEAVSYGPHRTKPDGVREEDMESSRQGPEINGNDTKILPVSKETSTQTEYEESLRVLPRPPRVTETDVTAKVDTADEAVQVNIDALEENSDTPEENGSWWRYLYPFYYFG